MQFYENKLFKACVQINNLTNFVVITNEVT
jgi:hypothetical protein